MFLFNILMFHMFTPVHVISPLRFSLTRSFSHQKTPCILAMYTSHHRKVTKKFANFYPATVHRVQDVVCDFLNVSSENDKRFVESLLINRTFRWFEFFDSSPIIRGIVFTGNLDLVFSNKKFDIVPKPSHRIPKIKMEFRNIVQEESHLFTAKEIAERESFDPVLAAFAYSDTFELFKEHSYEYNSVRLLEKV